MFPPIRTMKIAIPIFGKNISPRFDGAQVIVLLTVEGGQVVRREKWRTQNLSPLALVGGLRDAKVDVLICGNIDSVSEEAVEEVGIKLIPWVTGEAEGAITCFLKGELAPGSIVGSQGICGRWGVGAGRWGCRKGRWYQEIISEREKKMQKGNMDGQGNGKKESKGQVGNNKAFERGRGREGRRRGKRCGGGRRA